MKQTIALKTTVLAISLLCLILGVVVLFGWYTNNVKFIQVLPMFVPMQYNTALGFLLAGIGLLSVLKDKKILGKLLFLIIGTIGILTLFEYIIGVNLGIDELMMEHHITVETSHPGRMAPNTALCFLLTAIAMFLPLNKGQKAVQISGVIGSMVFGLGLVAFVGYLIDMEVTYGWGKLTNMAVHTALGFMALGMGITSLSIYKEFQTLTVSNPNNDFWLTGYAFSVALIIFFIDLSLPLGISAGTLYVLIILFAWFIRRRYITLVLALFTTLLVTMGYFYSEGGAETWMVISNRSFSIMVICVVARLLLLIKKKNNELELTNAQMDLNLVEIKNKNRELEQFTYIASHDLQEPLRTVINFTDLFEQQYKEKLDEEGKKYLHFISRASKRMSLLIKGLLDYSRIGQNKERIKIDVNKMLNDLQVDLHATIDETGTSFDIGPLPKIRGFKVELRLLFQNLIHNAIKFRKDVEKPHIAITAKDKIEYYELSVKDNGIGIAEEHQKKIFSIFQRLHAQKEYEGTGIGLAHCKKIVELHQGTIRVSSIPNCGSEFIFTIKKF
ncbi:hypothetical protein FVB32_15980 [Flagellimonas hymeniacidonis]|uniref:histidine kinase n=1 Tax=Flagellimonas hymeniacidonis TaxID=2603628 RepID=A0A5C8V6B7_9FLAO|nr:ATP-binding protein [Flagellimonas hymeniacidonis]TXN36057.1 hypothetical protein FVB32_15980 [Flagellimonas hymeniacidonis]